MFKDEKIIEHKTCKHCNSSFEITDKDIEFYEKVSPVFTRPPLTPPYQGGEQTLPLTKGELEGVLDLGNGKVKCLIPSPTLCPDCRQQRRLSFRNERKLYKRKCDATGENIISTYSPDKPNKVYNQNFWWGDKWDGLDYSKSFDFNKTFFEQYDELIKKVPRYSLYNFDNENCEYVNYMPHSKNCYLVFGGWYNEDCYYGDTFLNSKKSIDGCYIFNSELCYEGTHIDGCYKCFYSFNSINSKNSYFIYDCENCEECIGCWNLKNKKLYILNKKVTKEEFEKKKNEIFTSNTSLKNFNEEFLNIIKRNSINKHIQGNNNTNTTGDYLYNCKDIESGFVGWDSENIHYSWRFNGKNCYDLSGCSNGELVLECGSCDYGFNICFSIDSEKCTNSFYLNLCNNCKNCFGCIGLRNKEYCILNKEYSKEEYEKLLPKIIEHMQKNQEWGEFFPTSISPFGYNETSAIEYFPISKEKALKKGFNWSDYESPFPKVDKVIKASMLPENISDIPDDILNWAIECEVSGKPFRIVRAELDFYRKHNLPIPKRHPDIRHLDRLALRNPRKLFDRKCDKCGKDIKTSYSSDRKEIVYCESCYEKEVY